MKKMTFEKKITIIAIILLVIIVGVRMYYVINQMKVMQESENIIRENLSEQKAEIPEDTQKITTFYYFVSETDENYEQAISLFEELKGQYGEQIAFELNNVTKEPEFLETFPFVKDNTPAVIIDGRDRLVGYIYKALDKEKIESKILEAIKAEEYKK